jgi:hypothetical protein
MVGDTSRGKGIFAFNYLRTFMRKAERDMLIAVGKINMIWDEIDLLLWYEFDVLLNVHWSMSYSVFYSQQNSRNRREMILSLANIVLMTEPSEMQILERLLKRVDKAAAKRNDLTHGIWTSTKSGRQTTIQRIPIKRDAKAMPVKVIELPDLEETHDQLLHLHHDLHKHVHHKWATKNKSGAKSGALDIAYEPLSKSRKTKAHGSP